MYLFCYCKSKVGKLNNRILFLKYLMDSIIPIYRYDRMLLTAKIEPPNNLINSSTQLTKSE